MSTKKIDKENIFDLTKLTSFENDVRIKDTSKEITLQDRESLLQGCTEVPRDKWDTLDTDTYIRYLRKDGNFRIGGLVKNIWVSTNGKNIGKKVIQLSSNNSYKSNKWNIVLDDVEKIWKKNTIGSSTTGNSDMEKINKSNIESIEYLTKTVDQLKIDISKINNEQQRIVNLIRKLHNIKSLTSK